VGAAGAEIAASAMLDNKRAQVVGERTYGDAAVRRAISMDDGSAVILSVAKYYNAAGKTIQDTGVVPSVPYLENEAVLDQETEDAPAAAPKPAAPTRPEDDGLLKRAIEVLTKGPGPAAEKQAAPGRSGTLPERHPEIVPKQP
jgi:carboxyl-terminal processing protease